MNRVTNNLTAFTYGTGFIRGLLMAVLFATVIGGGIGLLVVSGLMKIACCG